MEGHTRRSYAESYAESIRGGDCHRLVPPPSGRSGNLIRFLKAWEGFSSSGLGGVGIAQVSLIHSNSKLLKMEGIRGGHTRSHTRRSYVKFLDFFLINMPYAESYAKSYAEVIRGLVLLEACHT